MRDKINEKLEEWQNKRYDIPKSDRRIFYGRALKQYIPDDWNYIVFGMEDLDKTGTNSMDLSAYYFVDIIREDFIDDETIFSIIKAMEEIPGMKLCRGKSPVDYIPKGNTDIICELMRLQFTRPMKRVNLNAHN